MPMPVREYWLYRDDSVSERKFGVSFKNRRVSVIVSKLLRAEILSRIHLSPMGAKFRLRKARGVTFWPGMSNEIKESVTDCQICADVQACSPLTATIDIREPRQTFEQGSSSPVQSS